MKHLLRALVIVSLLVTATALPATAKGTKPLDGSDNQSCTNNLNWDGCVKVSSAGRYIYWYEGGATGPNYECGYFKTGLQWQSGGTFYTTSTGPYTCLDFGLYGTVWGPALQVNQCYQTGTILYGWWSPHYQEKGHLTVSGSC